ncbi:uncharacterized protein AMSG_03772 [Thecamonas trahens ATCC 50062]|uniref:Transmembrane protein n=1 Tax=Thecamonas trahens ATCC 50062 TaxID=461836 RepID=A0A0L0D7Q6_THETB|nr:hypothetical protein AMSG_03772 [Thecamonas trahens ATCC 50062]KNC47338.1 hypothetical protein AMSG_03772 [Thecamonas trahens ATCC 50062]|eukprot:XP_013759676.1 hypothetical protein AMSG_03772 [Thecamonas trahens ATCC 50062]
MSGRAVSFVSSELSYDYSYSVVYVDEVDIAMSALSDESDEGCRGRTGGTRSGSAASPLRLPGRKASQSESSYGRRASPLQPPPGSPGLQHVGGQAAGVPPGRGERRTKRTRAKSPLPSTPAAGERFNTKLVRALARSGDAAAGNGEDAETGEAAGDDADVDEARLPGLRKTALLLLVAWAVSLIMLWILVVALFDSFLWSMVSLLVGAAHALLIAAVVASFASGREVLAQLALVSFPGMAVLRIGAALFLCITVNVRIDAYCRHEGTLLCGPSSLGEPHTPSRHELRLGFVGATFGIAALELLILAVLSKAVLNFFVAAGLATQQLPLRPVWRSLARIAELVAACLGGGRSHAGEACISLTWMCCCFFFGAAALAAAVLSSLVADAFGMVVYAGVDSL